MRQHTSAYLRAADVGETKVVGTLALLVRRVFADLILGCDRHQKHYVVLAEALPLLPQALAGASASELYYCPSTARVKQS